MKEGLSGCCVLLWHWLAYPCLMGRKHSRQKPGLQQSSDQNQEATNSPNPVLWKHGGGDCLRSPCCDIWNTESGWPCPGTGKWHVMPTLDTARTDFLLGYNFPLSPICGFKVQLCSLCPTSPLRLLSLNQVSIYEIWVVTSKAILTAAFIYVNLDPVFWMCSSNLECVQPFDKTVSN